MTQVTPAPNPPKAKSNKLIPVPLEEPIERGDQRIATVTIRKPQAGELRGLTLEDLMRSDVATVLELVPRISDPVLIDQEVAALDPVDLAQIGGVIRGFFMTKAERSMMDRMIAERAPKT